MGSTTFMATVALLATVTGGGALSAPVTATTPPAPTPVPTASPVPTATATAPAIATDWTALHDEVQAFVDEHSMNGAGLVVVTRDGGVVHEDYWGDFDAERVSFVASTSKQVTAGVLLHLADQGLVDLDAPVADAVAWGQGNPNITVADLVGNTSGLVGLGPDPTYAPYLCQFLPGEEIEACGETVFTTPDDDADIVAPDTEYRYGGAQWQVAGAVAEAVSGRTWAELIDEIYVQPCGLSDFGYNNHFLVFNSAFDYPTGFDGDTSSLPPTDNPNMEGGLYTTVPDYGRILQMHLDGGLCGDTQVLSADALATMYTDRLAPMGLEASPGTGYGYGWWTDRATGILYDPGAYGASAVIDPDAGWAYYLAVETTGDNGFVLSEQIRDDIATLASTSAD